MKPKHMIFGTVLLAASLSAQAEFFTGNTLYSRMISTDTIEKIMALGFVAGVHDATEGNLHCSGPTVTTGQVRDVVKMFLEKNPSTRDMSATLLVTVALSEAFPCAVKKKSKGGAPL
jgi:hypothetical protein